MLTVAHYQRAPISHRLRSFHSFNLNRRRLSAHRPDSVINNDSHPFYNSVPRHHQLSHPSPISFPLLHSQIRKCRFFSRSKSKKRQLSIFIQILLSMTRFTTRFLRTSCPLFRPLNLNTQILSVTRIGTSSLLSPFSSRSNSLFPATSRSHQILMVPPSDVSFLFIVCRLLTPASQFHLALNASLYPGRLSLPAVDSL